MSVTRSNNGRQRPRRHATHQAVGSEAAAPPASSSSSTRPALDLVVLGHAASGKKTLRDQWLNSSLFSVISGLADVRITIEKSSVKCVTDDHCSDVQCPTANSHVECLEVHSNQSDEHQRDGESSVTYLVMYRADDQDGIEFAKKCLEDLFWDLGVTSNVFVLENNFETFYKPSLQHSQKLPEHLKGDQDYSCSNVSFWQAKVLDGVQLSALFDALFKNPLLSRMDQAQCMLEACTEGKIGVLKLLLRQEEDSNPSLWLAQVLHSLESSTLGTPKAQGLMEIAMFAYHLDPMLSLSTVVRLANKYPHASLHLLNNLPLSPVSRANEFVKSGLALVSLPASWVSESHFSTIDLSNNLLVQLPKELFQLPYLQKLNVSHNRLESVPPILQWNCPFLRELDLSSNKLYSTSYEILEGKVQPQRDTNNMVPEVKFATQKEVSAAQRLLNLTGQNLFPCVQSLLYVNISDNPKLTQVPEWVCLLPQLTMLSMTGLPKMAAITPFLAHCKNLHVMTVDPESLQSPPPDVANQGTRAMIAYLRCKLKGSTPFWHMKLVLVGCSKVGKTTLFSQLAGTKPAEQFSSAFDMTHFTYPPGSRNPKEKPKVNFHLIKCSGDDACGCTHQCLFTYRSIFLCLWDVTQGKEGLRALCPWLRSIQACVPRSPVVLVGTHGDKRPGLTLPRLMEWMKDVFGDVSQLSQASYAERFGLPAIIHSVVMDCLNVHDVDMLLKDVYQHSLQAKHPYTKRPLLQEPVPRSFHELHSLVEVKVRSWKQERQSTPVLRREEFVDYVRSLTLHGHSIDEDEEDFALACQFLHEAGSIIHFRSHMVGLSDLYFLDPQWLYQTLAAIIGSRLHLQASPVLMHSELPALLQEAGVPTHLFSSFLSLLENYEVLVHLDMNQSSLLIPSLLPPSPPLCYPAYNLSEADVMLKYIKFNYLPFGFFPRLQSRLLMYIRQLSGQLLVVGSDPSVEDAVVPFSRVPSRPFRLDKNGFLFCEEPVADYQERLLERLWALSTSSSISASLTRQHSLTKELVNLSKPFLKRTHHRSSSGDNHTSPFISSDELSSSVFWKKGLYVEFPCGTCLWVEDCEGAVVAVAKGEEVSKVKVLSFVAAGVKALMDESFSGLQSQPYSPCPSCLRQFSERHGLSTDSSCLTQSQELSTTVSMNEFKEEISYSPLSIAHQRRAPHYSFAGSAHTLVPKDKSPTLLDGEVAMFSLSQAVHEAAVCSQQFHCVKCNSLLSWREIFPSVLLVDFSDNLLLNSKKLKCSLSSSCVLGQGGSGRVFKGSYAGEPVAVKVFTPRRSHLLLEDVSTYNYLSLRAELNILCHLEHPRVVHLLGVCLEPLCMVLELAPLGSLATLLPLCPQGLVSNVSHLLLLQIADGLHYLHSLYLIHRDVKPGNALVWSLSPEKVDVRLADYGFSQFSTPVGLGKGSGTEEYLAPEILGLHGATTYDEKVDLFSYGLLLHYVVTGQRLFAGAVGKQERLNILRTSKVPRLVQALSESYSPTSSSEGANSQHRNSSQHQNSFPPVTTAPSPSHPAARSETITACHSTCMQQLLEACLSLSPSDRPSAQSVVSHLLVCPGSLTQANFFINTRVRTACYCPVKDVVIAMRGSSQSVFLLSPQTWAVNTANLPYMGEAFSCMACVDGELFMSSSGSRLIFSMRLPALASGHISHQPLPSRVLCLFAQPAKGGARLVVGLEQASIAVFTPSPSRHMLEEHPYISTLVSSPDSMSGVQCGAICQGRLWFGCGHTLLSVDRDAYCLLQSRRMSGVIDHVVASRGNLWMNFVGGSEVLVCNGTNGNVITSISCSTILSLTRSSAVVSAMAVSPGHGLVWLGTKGGHLVGVDPISTDLLLVRRRQTSILSVVAVGDGHVITFGHSSLERGLEQGEGGEDGETESGEEDISGTFTVWRTFHPPNVS